MKTQTVIVLILVVVGVWQWDWDTSSLEVWIERNPVLGAGVYVVLLAAPGVVLPFSSLPLLPLATRSFGVVPTAVLSSVGWWGGCLIAFQIARAGRRFLERVTSLDAVDRVAKKVPQDVGFGGIVVLRVTLPTDVVSFALGLLKGLDFRTYAVASLVGILPFSFLWCYAGGELGASRLWSFALVIAVMTVVIVVIRRWWQSVH